MDSIARSTTVAMPYLSTSCIEYVKIPSSWVNELKR